MDILKAEKYPIIGIISMKNTGKSVMVKHLTKQYRLLKKFDIAYCFCNTCELNTDYDYLPNKYVINNVNETIIHQIMSKQVEKIKSKKDIKNILFIFDDVMGDINLKKSGILQTLFTQNRQYRISIIVSVQQLSSVLPPYVRNNVSSYIFSKNNKTNIECIYNETEYNGTIKQFINFVHTHCIDYYFMVYTKGVSNNSFFKIKANLNENLKINY